MIEHTHVCLDCGRDTLDEEFCPRTGEFHWPGCRGCDEEFDALTADDWERRNKAHQRRR
jgi:hypothetical protein